MFLFFFFAPKKYLGKRHISAPLYVLVLHLNQIGFCIFSSLSSLSSSVCMFQNLWSWYLLYSFLYARLETGRIMWLGMAGGHPHRFPHNNFSSVYQIFTKLDHMIPLWEGKNPIYVGVIRSKVKVTVTINIIFDNRVISTW